MGEVIAFEDLKKSAAHCEVLTLFKASPMREAEAACWKSSNFPSSRPGTSGNLGDLFEQAGAVMMRHYEGDKRVPDIVARKCLELLEALASHAEPE